MDGDSPYGVGYDSQTEWNLTDACGSSDAGLDANEVFGTFVADYSGNNWPYPTAGYGNLGTSYVTDMLIATDPPASTPAAEYPQSPLGTTAVRHNPWLFYVGSVTSSSGVLVHTDTQQNYQDHGRHQ